MGDGFVGVSSTCLLHFETGQMLRSLSCYRGRPRGHFPTDSFHSFISRSFESRVSNPRTIAYLHLYDSGVRNGFQVCTLARARPRWPLEDDTRGLLGDRIFRQTCVPGNARVCGSGDATAIWSFRHCKPAACILGLTGANMRLSLICGFP